MRRTLVVVFIALVAGLFPSHAQAQRTQNDCVQQFYDAGNFHYLAFRNICGAPIYVVWMSKSPGLRGKMDIGPGMSAPTGKFEKDIALFDGVVYYACFKGYIPVDSTDQPVSRPGAQFRCKRY